MKYDFSGYCTRADIRCADGRVIRKHAFKDCDGKTVPLIWNHDHVNPFNVIGHALLEDRDDGMFAYGMFNNSPEGEHVKELVKHGDIEAMSIYANKLQQEGSDVIHGMIREVSLVYAGANPGAFIENVMIHGEESDSEAIIYSGNTIDLYHSDKEGEDGMKETVSNANEKTNDETVEDIFNTLSEKQKEVVYALIGAALSDEEGDGDDMKHNVFDDATNGSVKNSDELLHADIMAAIDDCNKKRYGSMKDAFLAHGITDIEYLFPDFKTMSAEPGFVKRDTGWVSEVMSSIHRTPFSRIKSVFADITADDARAKGYVKTKKKVEEVITLLKRTTEPQTVYKKQKIDRDDAIDIVDFDVVRWLKSEMRLMLDEELARAFLIGDGRSSASDDKIKDDHIRPIWGDDELYTITDTLEFTDDDTDDTRAKAFIRAAIKNRAQYQGSGNPVLFTTESLLSEILLLEDTTGRFIYDSEEKLARTLRVKKIVTVPVMEGATREVMSVQHHLMGLIVNLNDYNVGADKGGAINMFDDFDIDYNQMKYLIETRCSGALTKPRSAIAIEYKDSAGGLGG